jgi:hypothetical protein
MKIITIILLIVIFLTLLYLINNKYYEHFKEEHLIVNDYKSSLNCNLNGTQVLTQVNNNNLYGCLNICKETNKCNGVQYVPISDDKKKGNCLFYNKDAKRKINNNINDICYIKIN